MGYGVVVNDDDDDDDDDDDIHAFSPHDHTTEVFSQGFFLILYQI